MRWACLGRGRRPHGELKFEDSCLEFLYFLVLFLCVGPSVMKIEFNSSELFLFLRCHAIFEHGLEASLQDFKFKISFLVSDLQQSRLIGTLLSAIVCTL